jgi:hypothetical protein
MHCSASRPRPATAVPFAISIDRPGYAWKPRGLFPELRTVFGRLPLRPDVRAGLAGRLTDEALLDVRQPDMIKS